MSFICPDCRGAFLEISSSIDLGSTPVWDELALQIVACDRCGFTGVAVYEESRRGALDQDIHHHTGYRLEAGRVALLAAMVTACPRPDDHRCGCFAHRYLRKTDPRTGSWVGIANLGWIDYFPLEIAPEGGT